MVPINQSVFDSAGLFWLGINICISDESQYRWWFRTSISNSATDKILLEYSVFTIKTKSISLFRLIYFDNNFLWIILTRSRLVVQLKQRESICANKNPNSKPKNKPRTSSTNYSDYIQYIYALWLLQSILPSTSNPEPELTCDPRYIIMICLS